MFGGWVGGPNPKLRTLWGGGGGGRADSGNREARKTTWEALCTLKQANMKKLEGV